MGHLSDPLNTFWQLLVRPAGTATWSDDVEATAVATNGGLVLAAGGPSVVVGVRPSNLLTYSPLISTFNGGRSWPINGLAPGLAAVPNGVAVGPVGQALAIVDAPGHPEVDARVVTSQAGLSGWTDLISQPSLQASTGAKPCNPQAITAVAFEGGSPVIGVACRAAGIAGVLKLGIDGWGLIGPAVPASVGPGAAIVLSLRADGTGLALLLEVVGPDGPQLVAAESQAGGAWALSPALSRGSAEALASIGPDGSAGTFVLASQPAGTSIDQPALSLEAWSGGGTAWTSLPAPPTGTATAVFGPGSEVQALAVSTNVLTVWQLTAARTGWRQVQTMHVPIVYGSSN